MTTAWTGPVGDGLDLVAPRAPDRRGGSSVTLVELIDHIEQTHHAYLKTELPRMEALAAAVARRFGEERPQLTEIAAEIAHVRVEIEWHLRKEELVLFPLCRKLEQDHAALTWQSPGTAGAIGVLIAEHDEFTAALLRLRELSSDFAPASASLSHRALLDALEIFDRDMQVHLRKEDEMLFPRAIGLQLLLASCRHRRKAGRGIGESRNTE